MPIQKLPVTGGAYTSVDDAQLVDSDKAPILRNLLIDETGTNLSRPGIVEFATLSTVAVGLTAFKNQIIAVLEDGNLSSIDPITATITNITGTALTGQERPTFASDGTLLAITAGDAPLKYTGSGTTSLLGGTPPDSTFILFLDNYFLANEIDSHRVRFSGPTDREIWDALDVFSAEGSPDKAQALITLIRELYVVGEHSTEIWQNFGEDADVPFQRTYFIDRGTPAAYSVVSANNAIWYLDQFRRFIVINGRRPEIISSPYDKEVQAFDTISDCWAGLLELGNQYLIMWTFPSEGRTFWFNYINKQWGEFVGFEGGFTKPFRMNAITYEPLTNRYYVADRESGKIGYLSLTTYQDFGESILRQRRSGFFTHGTFRQKRTNELRMLLKRGLTAASASNVDFIEIRTRDGQGQWSQPLSVPIGYTGDDFNKVKLKRFGTYTQRQYDFQYSGNTDFKLLSLEEDFEFGAS